MLGDYLTPLGVLVLVGYFAGFWAALILFIASVTVMHMVED